MKDPKDKDLKIEIAPKEAIRFNQMVVDYFIVKILGINSFMITDESYISDMTKPWGHKTTPMGNDEYKRTETHFDAKKAQEETGKLFFKLSRKEREKHKVVHEVIYQKDELAWPDDILFRTWDFFGVHLDAKFLDGSFVELGKELSSQISEEKRNELIGSYPSLFPDYYDEE